MLRALVLALLLANAAFYGWTRGWFSPVWPAPRQGEREPTRLAAQVSPERVTVLPPRASNSGSAPGAEPPACIEAGPFDTPDLAAAEAALSQAGVPAAAWSRLPETSAPAGRQWLRLAQPEAAWLPKLQGLPSAVVGAGFKACAGR
jgi:hypothetical protein